MSCNLSVYIACESSYYSRTRQLERVSVKDTSDERTATAGSRLVWS
jgi:hypothetical protein